MRNLAFRSTFCTALLIVAGCADHIATFEAGDITSISVEEIDLTSECHEISMPDGSVNVHAERCIEAGPGFRYEFDIFELQASGATYFARSYTSDPHEIHFLGKGVAAERSPLSPADVESESFRQAVTYLRRQGKTHINYLSFQNEGYVPVPR